MKRGACMPAMASDDVRARTITVCHGKMAWQGKHLSRRAGPRGNWRVKETTHYRRLADTLMEQASWSGQMEAGVDRCLLTSRHHAGRHTHPSSLLPPP
jgi:hypothetical protein